MPAATGHVIEDAGHMRKQFGRTRAGQRRERLLGCSPRVWALLTAEGLAGHPTPCGERFDGRDLFNLAVHSGSRGSVPEVALTLALRFARQNPRFWEREREWELRVTLRDRRRRPGHHRRHATGPPQLLRVLADGRGGCAARLSPVRPCTGDVPRP
ncbi:hypothetical protein [Streptomyces sp. NBC_01262]|uniref:hypothetical protein n=1 Tax=Streptomyces sp. NBC_01262 TaxID=2903803 RepID=UPI002E33110B|nr:hypothetical protein [Streptomyces sp. NBC_01262]